ncbi:MAG: hypothetical protein ABJC98_21590 [Bacteroidota bacterium]
MASYPNDAMNWTQAGGSLKAYKAGVSWCSIPFRDHIRHAGFIDMQKEIKSK